jgi:hypothetical protein
VRDLFIVRAGAPGHNDRTGFLTELQQNRPASAPSICASTVTTPESTPP